MLKPIGGLPSVLPLIDHIVESRPYLPPLTIGVVCADADEARLFVAGYRDRLTDVRDRPLVPHAYTGPAALSLVKAAAAPDVVLVDEIAKQLRSSVPPGAGQGWRTKQFTLCLDVLQGAGRITRTTAEATREALLDWLYGQWERRHRLLAWTRAMSAAELPGKVLGLVLVALLNGPSRWWFGRRLGSRRLRWFTDHVTNATGQRGDFLNQATDLLPGGGVEDVTALRCRILFDALLRDLALFTRRRRFLPQRRRRRWTPVLLLDGTHPIVADLIDFYAELTRTWQVMPALVVAALDDPANPGTTAAGVSVLDIDEAAPAVRALIDKDEPEPPRRLVLRLPHNPAADPAAELYLPAHRRVTPRVPSRFSALAPFALTALLLTASSGFAAYQYFDSGCADTKVNALHERVGVIESGCSFDQPASPAGAPNLADLEQAVVGNNAAVDRLKDDDGRTRYHREVVFFGPLTRPDGPERTAPANAVWQLQGAVEAQRKHNEDAARDIGLVPVKLVLANSGDRFGDGAWVASKIAERPQDGDGDLAAVIGISQSRPDAGAAIRDHLGNIPVIGASMYGSRMTENDNMFLSAPLTKAFAVRMAEWLRDKDYAGRAVVVYDPDDDYYSRELHDHLRAQGIGTDSTDIRINEVDDDGILDHRIAAMCATPDRQIPVLTNRADQILKFLDRAGNIGACTRRDGPMPVLAGPGVMVEAATGTLAQRYPGARLTITSLADTAAESEKSTGRDAFRIAAAAIEQAQQSADGSWKPALVRTMLSEPEVFRTLGLPKFNDDTETGRVRLIDVGP